MKTNYVVTIGRQFGSGGRLIGEQLAKKLKIDFYDRELINLAAKEAGVDPNVFANVDERAVNSLLYALSMGIYNMGNSFSPVNTMPDSDRLYIAQHKIISDIIKKGPCVIVGRCSDYILRDKKDCIKIFIHAPLEYRKKRVIETYNIEESKASDTIKKTDKTRSNYYNFYTSQKWGNPENYDLTLNSSKLSIEENAEFLKNYVNMRLKYE